MPSLLDLHHDQPDLAILAVSIDEDPDAYSHFIARRHVDLITVRDPGQTAAKLYHTEGGRRPTSSTARASSGANCRRPRLVQPELREYLKT